MMGHVTTGRARHFALGGLATLAVTLAAAWLSAAPAWQTLPPATAVLRVSFTHSGDRSSTCRDRTAEELAKLPPNMRARQICDRRRPPLWLELDVDGRTLLAALLPPSGLAGSGPSRVYERFELPAGPHEIRVRLRDRPGTTGFDYEARTSVILAPAQSFVIDFRPGAGGFVFR
jgi:hypothetical protein